MAVGDGNNDIGLMTAAGFSVAMGNAVEAVKALADATTGDCDHDGAARAVLKYMLGEDERQC
jgi:hydroxymethylpyrimidine pyrophosphatase-like HAD family hydrolase